MINFEFNLKQVGKYSGTIAQTQKKMTYRDSLYAAYHSLQGFFSRQRVFEVDAEIKEEPQFDRLSRVVHFFSDSLKTLGEIPDDFAASRKNFNTVSKVTGAASFGYIGLQIGTFFYLPAFPILPLFSGTFCTVAGVAIGAMAGKYFAQFCTYIYTRGKRTNSDPFTLPAHAEERVNAQCKIVHFYSDSCANLMYSYLLNKLEIAKENRVDKEAIDTFLSYRKSLRQGKLSDELKTYFKNEHELIHTIMYSGTPEEENDTQLTLDLHALTVIIESITPSIDMGSSISEETTYYFDSPSCLLSTQNLDPYQGASAPPYDGSSEIVNNDPAVERRQHIKPHGRT